MSSDAKPEVYQEKETSDIDQHSTLQELSNTEVDTSTHSSNRKECTIHPKQTSRME